MGLNNSYKVCLGSCANS